MNTQRRWFLVPLLCAAGGLTFGACLPNAPRPAAAPDLGPSQVSMPDMAQGTIDAPTNLSARLMFDLLVRPSLAGQPEDGGRGGTCGGCHYKDGGVGPGFLRSASPDKYDPYPIISTWNNFIVPNPELSQLITKGRHEGPPLAGADSGCTDQCGLVLAWLQQEKVERDRTVMVPFKPQVKPFVPNMAPQTTQVDLGQISKAFTGAYLSFVATPIGNDRGLEISNLRFFNVEPGAMPTDQRTIHFVHPLFIVWLNGVPHPDPVDNFSGTDRTIKLNQNDTDAKGNDIPGAGNLIVPGLFTLSEYRTGAALSVAFDLLELLGPVPGANPCKPAGLTVFTNQVTPYLKSPASCSRDGNCHNSTGLAAGIDMSVLASGSAKATATLCEQLKYYNSLNILADNTDPSKPTHPFKWTSTSCAAAGFPATCFNDFSSVLATWRDAEK